MHAPEKYDKVFLLQTIVLVRRTECAGHWGKECSAGSREFLCIERETYGRVDREDQIPRQLHDPVGLLRVLPDLFGGRLAVELLEERIERQLHSISRENSTLFTTLSLLLFRNSGIGGRSSDSIQ